MSFLLLLPLLFSAPTYAQLLKIKAEVLSQYDALFARYAGWTGADGDYSVALSDKVTLWLYSDTWVGKVRANRHVDSTMINNSVALQHGKDPRTATVKFFYGKVKNGKPTALIIPADGQGRFWLHHGVLTEKGLYLFMMQIDSTADGGFKQIGEWLGHVSNPDALPSKWHITQRKIPFGRFSAQGDTVFGSSLLKDNGFIYIYGNDEDIEDGSYHRKHMIVARVAEDDLADFDKWRFYTNGDWQPDFKKASRLCPNIANEYSVSYQPSVGKYVMVYTENGISKNIVLRIAPTPYGEWSEPTIVYQCPESAWNAKIVCYAAKAHLTLSMKPDELIVTYIASSSDFFHMAGDARLYRPRFLRLQLSPSEGDKIDRQCNLNYMSAPNHSFNPTPREQFFHH
jgi:hypothetical protein